MMELISEQAKDLKLYEQICRAIMPENDFKKVILIFQKSYSLV